MSENIIKMTGGVVRQQKNTILKNINLEIKQGEFIYLIGKVGSGKSSFLKTLYAELPLEYGNAEVAGFQLKKLRKSQIPLLRRKCGIVFQDFKLLIDRNVHSNLEFVLRATGWKNKKAIEERIVNVLTKVDMLHKKTKMPHQLSGGEQQRIVLARALLNVPPLIIADEPTGNIDPETSYRLIELLKDICDTGKTVIIATHQYDLIKKYPGRILCCENGEIVDKTSPLACDCSDAKGETEDDLTTQVEAPQLEEIKLNTEEIFVQDITNAEELEELDKLEELDELDELDEVQEVQVVKAPEVVEVVKVPEVVEVVKTPEVVEVVKAPEVVEVVKAPEVVEVVKAPEVVEVVKTPEVVEVVKTPEVVEVVKAPEVVEVVKTPEVVEVVKTPEVVEVVETPEVVEVVKTPEVVEVVETPETPEAPEETRTPAKENTPIEEEYNKIPLIGKLEIPEITTFDYEEKPLPPINREEKPKPVEEVKEIEEAKKNTSPIMDLDLMD